MICPLHGPVWRSNIDWSLQKYQKWTTWTPEEEGYTIVYGSMYGHTASAAEAAATYIQKKSGKPVRVYDVSETPTSYLISEIWNLSGEGGAGPGYHRARCAEQNLRFGGEWFLGAPGR